MSNDQEHEPLSAIRAPEYKKINSPRTQQLLACENCSKHGQPRKSHKAGVWRIHWSKNKLGLTCRTCGKKLLANLNKNGLMVRS